MRKIDKAMCAAVKAHQYFKSGNTEVNVRLDMCGNEHIEVRLHGNIIWRWSEAEDMTEFTLAGWNTPVTRSRLHALGVDVYGRCCSGFHGDPAEHWPMCDGMEIDPHKWYEIRNGKIVNKQ